MTLGSLSRWLFLSSRAVRDVNALQRGGPKRLAKRQARRFAYRMFFKGLRKLT